MPNGGFSSHYELAALQPLLEQGCLVLTPNQRLARTVKASWDRQQAERGLRAWRPATVRALDTWLDQCWREALSDGLVPARVRLSALQERELWARVIAEDADQHGAYRLLQPGGAAELAAAAREQLLQARVDYAAPAAQAEFRLDTDCTTFLRWLRAFDEALARGALATRSDCLRDLCERAGEPVCERVVLLDCDELTPLQRGCLESLARGVGRTSGLGALEAPLHAAAYPDRAAELAAIASWAHHAYAANPDCRLGIVLRDMRADRETLEYLLRREFDCLGDKYTALPVNFSTGISLDRAPVVRDALRMLACGDREIPLADVLGLLNSRFAEGIGGTEDTAVRLVQQLYADGREIVGTGRLRALAPRDAASGAPTTFGARLSAVNALRLQRDRLPPSGWAKRVHEVLALWGWPGPGPLDSLEFQQVKDWYQVLEDFAACDLVQGEVDYSAALGLLRRCCQARMAQPQTADSGIQVLGPLEAAGLQFDETWLCAMEASRWPPPARPNPFVPLRMQRAHAMPHAGTEYEWQYAEGLLRQYRVGCTRLRASYARQLDGAPELPSPLLHGAAIEECTSAPGLPAAWLEQWTAGELAAIEDDLGPPLPGEGTWPGGSALLQDQASCPFRAFSRHRLGAQVLDSSHAGLSARERGNLLHDALFALWGALVDSARLAGMDDQARTAALEAAVDAAIEAVPAPVRLLVGAHCLDLERRRLRVLLGEWLELECTRQPFTVAVREAPRDASLGRLAFRLRVDRVDSLADGSQLVIDYKSGRCTLADWLGERPAEPQLPLYCLVTDAAGVAFAQVRARDCKLIGLGDVDGVPGVSNAIDKVGGNRESSEDWPTLRAQWRVRLQNLADGFVGGEARVDPLPQACDYCGLQAFCRVSMPVAEDT